MPKKLDPELKARAVRLVLEHRAVYPTGMAAVLAVAKQVGVGKGSLRAGCLRPRSTAARSLG